ncbi:MAG: tRNA (adenosine(37)-N6)-dimethylallyltransferase MiaA [Oscillospiraceae bacterium]|nr:tRNA (adenosine(37)-N6)-dimethylallyltransferase MiaA [Oscillospiraceae bacterium]MCR5307138.1 tRNA (adenosine(37)-N6)-dimethylallyltransferase MiaA [Oscillospiraceae bacterium]
MQEKPLLIAVVGATASGKSALGAEIAAQYGGEVISADSMQLYEGLDIATAKPTAEEMRGVPHHLISVLPPDHACSVAEYVDMAREKISELLSRGRLPVIVGGTGLYADSLLDNIQFPEIPADEALRERLHREAETLGNAAMLSRLAACDPETAARLHENNLRRIIRALEVYELTGIPLSEHARRSRAVPPPWNVLRIGIAFRERGQLYDRIRVRVGQMCERGLAEEVREEYGSGRRRDTAAMAIGYKELLPWVRGEEAFSEGIERVRRETCRYAKRQETWFRRNAQINWINRDENCENREIFSTSKKIIEKCTSM